MPISDQSFDRVRPRSAADRREPAAASALDREGKRALFSEVSAPGSPGSVTITCPRCDAVSVITVTTALRQSFPAVPAVLPRQGLRANMKCPACGVRGWLAVSLRG
jgi:phage FluMu protein Com